MRIFSLPDCFGLVCHLWVVRQTVFKCQKSFLRYFFSGTKFFRLLAVFLRRAGFRAVTGQTRSVFKKSLTVKLFSLKENETVKKSRKRKKEREIICLNYWRYWWTNMNLLCDRSRNSTLFDLQDGKNKTHSSSEDKNILWERVIKQREWMIEQKITTKGEGEGGNRKT